MKILLIEDDTTIAYGIKRHLNQIGYDVHVASTVREVDRYFMNVYDLLIVDVNLPDGSGLEVVKEYKSNHNTPIIFVTANDSEATINTAFDIGADDYMTKPFRLSELSRRIQAITRRIRANIISIGCLTIDTEKLSVQINDVDIVLSIQEFKILVYLARNTNKLITRQELNTVIWDTNEHISDNALSVTIKRLREKLGDAIQLETIHGKGYLLKHEPHL
ncbi:response regulator transcription factor [Erysipelothrix sp. HDW6A]|uniref:response regulator transcription factor n=1 Tax=Erysipelothrix sp. HDW6A TaxID=2714928 RepID=UPI00140BC81F|nr:response regulator transcription factor [Erysipelothrix sp. HDW6A]QIK58019.1 response regulator transcription factor [Erysipelothrix sp. HDW6A]